MNYLLIPGNPPAVYFYKLWKSEIESIEPKALVQVSSYGEMYNQDDFSVQQDEILFHHQTQLKKFHKQVGNPVTIIGHSLGGFVALQLLEKYPQLIKDVILLHPFLRKPDPKGRFILKTVAALSKIQVIPNLVIKNRHILEWFSNELPFVTNEEMALSFKIGHFEANTILEDSSPLSFDHLEKKKLKVYYHPQDIWCPSEVVVQLKDQIQAIQCHEPHGFITEKKHRESLWKKMSGK